MQLDTAYFALRPLIELVADPQVPPALMAAAPLHWSQAGEPTGWSAMRPPPARLRSLLARAGLVSDPADVWGALPVEIGRRVSDVIEAAEPEPTQTLWAARLAILLGSPARSVELLGRIRTDANPAVLGWRDLLLGRADGHHLDPTLPDALRLAVALRAVGDAIAAGEPVEPPLSVAQGVADQIAAEDPVLGAVAAARVGRWQAPEADRIEQIRARLNSARVRAIPPLRFLLDDAEVALLVAASTAAGIEPGVGYAWAQAAVALDPSGAETLLVAGDLARAAGRLTEARGFYRRCVRHGLAERERALSGLLDLGRDLPAVVVDLFSLTVSDTGDRRRCLAGHADTLAAGPVADAVAWATAEQPDPLPLPLPLERLRTFLDLRPPGCPGPVNFLAHNPLMAWRGLIEDWQPWFATATPQRIAPARLRAELSRAADFFEHPTPAASESYQDWLTAPDGCPEPLRARLAALPDASMLDRARLGRLLIGLGFHTRAKAILPEPGTPIRTPEDGFAVSTWILAEYQLTVGTGKDLDPHFRRLDEQLGTDARYARLRLMVTVNAAVSAAQQRDVATVARWRGEGELALKRYVALPEVDDFEAALITSRFYRAMGFLPWLTGDRDTLIADMDRWLGIARELRGHDYRTQILAPDNLFPAIETAARTHSHLGDHDRALALAEEMVRLEPMTAKAWVDVAELRYRAGDVRGALEAYQWVGYLGLPHARLGWFHAGQCHEQLGEPDEAAECYRRSLGCWPTGVTPLRRIRTLVDDPTLTDSRSVLLAWAARQPAWPQA